ncbi:EF-hand domain-containing protein [Jannaschia seohaensis]|uniref:EF hand n=1 Tax=Jannaschia seohaensis TaxID=475081 RepID=A0A2Y9ABT3_9RHOB|nr:hypothetical protein [Jannaschia seohaensis]PWJ21235.1 EF hand domain-containing protein [Jannaschia seohaensis]SSA41645.1 EF hand [Jannaschia seohaensis]
MTIDPLFKRLIPGLAAGAAMLTLTSMADAAGPRPAFSEVDANGDGAVTQDELRALARGRGRDRLAAADADGDGVLTRDEALAAAQERAADRVNRMFDRLDTDGDDALTEAERMAGREAHGDRMRHGGGRMFQRADANGDGSIDSAEWDALPRRR